MKAARHNEMFSIRLTYFREAVLSGSIRRAADRLSIAPSALSRQIGKLEAELNATLIDRRSRRLTLTAAGQIVLAFAEQARQEVNDLRAALGDLSGVRAGHVRVASVEGMVAYFLARQIADFEKRYPGVTLSVLIVGSRAVLDMLRDGQADMALAFNAPKQSQFQEHARVDQPLCAICKPSHPLAKVRNVSICDLTDQHVVLPDRSFQIRFIVDRAASRAKVSLRREVECNSLEMVKGIVRNSGMVTFLPRYAALREINNGELCAIPLREREFQGTSVTLLTSRSHELSRAAQAMLEAMKKSMRPLSGRNSRG